MPWRGVGRERAPTLLFVAIRFAFIAFFLFTSLYCLLAYIPFSFYWLIQTPVVSWLPVVVRLHAALFWILLPAVAATVLPYLQQPATRRLAIGFLISQVLAGIALAVRLRLAAAPNDFTAFYWSLCALFPLFFLGLLDYAAAAGRSQPEVAERGLSLRAAVAAALFLSALYAVSAWLRRPEGTHYGAPEWLAVGWSVVSHLVVFLVLFVAVQMIGAVARRFRTPATARFVGMSVVSFLIGAVVFRKLIFASLAFNGHRAAIIGLAISATVTLAVGGIEFRLRAADGAFTLAPLVRAPFQSRVARGLWMVILAALPLAIPALLGPLDWESVLQKLLIVAIWAVTLALFHVSFRARRQYSLAAVLLIAVAVGAGYKGLAWSQRWWPRLAGSESDVASLLERYAGADLSFHVAGDVLTPIVDDDAHADFYSFLQSNTNMEPSVGPAAPELELAGPLQPTPSKKPNIFIIVVDSLRQDYLSPYNPAVDFTPHIAKFAAESVVMANAFTRYTGTALSETTIWLGGMQLHKLYMQPFDRVNALQKLLDAEGYTQFVTVDPILKLVLTPNPRRVELDAHVRHWTEYDLGHTLKELEDKMDARGAAAGPIFFFSQPHNIHALTLFRFRQTRYPKRPYPGFSAPTAAELERMDAPFGEFIAFLKARGLYDNSIIVLTSDHGECFGESARLGHTSGLFPQVIRVPLIIHLPPALRAQVVWDAKEVAFSADVTPSLYYLLGHRPIRNSPVLGRPLFTATADEYRAYVRPYYLLASSYAPVYGILANRGQALFIVDARGANYFYDLTRDPAALHNHVTEAIRAANEKLIRAEIDEITRFYSGGR
jgi:hypothetical protein